MSDHISLHQWTEQRYPEASQEEVVYLKGIERFNPLIPDYVDLDDEVFSYRRLQNVATQIAVTGGELSESGKTLLKSLEIER